MTKRGMPMLQTAALALLVMATMPLSSRADTGTVRVEFTKGGFIIGFGGGRGVLTLRGHNYPFRVSGMSFGATIGGWGNQPRGEAVEPRSPGRFARGSSAHGAGGGAAWRA